MNILYLFVIFLHMNILNEHSAEAKNVIRKLESTSKKLIRGATRGGGSKGSADPPEMPGGARFGSGARFGGGARFDINHAFFSFFFVGARLLQNFCSG